MKTKLPLVSVIIPVYNAEKYIKQAIESVLYQTYKNVEIIIVNDFSTDKSDEIIKSLMAKHKEVNILYFINEKNLGVAESRNIGIRYASGEYIAFLDADDYWFPNKLEKQINLFLQNPNIGLVHTYKVVLKEDKNFWFPTKYHLKLINRLEGEIYDKIIQGNWICTSSVMIKKCIIDKVGFFNSKFSPSEDWDLWIRMAKVTSFGLVREFLTCYRHNDLGISKDVVKYSNSILSIVNTYVKHKSFLIRLKAYGYCYYNIGSLYLVKWDAKNALKNYFKIETLISQCLNQFYYKNIIKAILGKDLFFKLKKIIKNEN